MKLPKKPMIKLMWAQLSSRLKLTAGLCYGVTLLGAVFSAGQPQAVYGQEARAEKTAFRWQLAGGEILEVNKFGVLRVRSGLDQAFQQFKNKIVLRVGGNSPAGYPLTGRFYTYVRPDLKGIALKNRLRYWNTGAAFYKESEFFSNFLMKPTGEYEVGPSYLMPNLRHMPTFPGEAISKGAMWNAPGEEILRLSKAVRLPLKFNVRYRYHGYETVTVPLFDGTEKKMPVDVFEFSYAVDGSSMQEASPPKAQQMKSGKLSWDQSFVFDFQKGKLGKDFGRTRPAVAGAGKVQKSGRPVRDLKGTSKNLLYFDRKTGIPIFDRNNYELVIHYKDGQVAKFNSVIDSFYRKYRPIGAVEKDKIIAGFRKNNPNQELDIKKTDRGIKFNLGDILFDYNSHRLRPEGMATLDKISGLLAKYPNREIVVDGFTDSKGSEAYNLKLSNRRAKSVSNYLLQKGINGNRIAYRGNGEKNPVASNDSEAGRQLNRRVELMLVTE